jgi:hypothetical protein
MKTSSSAATIALAFRLPHVIAAKAKAYRLPFSETRHIDQTCIDFCDDYFHKYCMTSNAYISSSDSSFDAAMNQCQVTCMQWPRPVDPATFSLGIGASEDEKANVFNSNLGGDTYWCRKRHMTLVHNFNEAAFHCPHATDAGAGVCTDVEIDGYTPYQRLQLGQPSRSHKYGWCDIASNGLIAECTMMGIGEDTLPMALQMLPDTVEYIFLNGNAGITTLPDDIFLDNLMCPEILQAVYMNDCSIALIGEAAFNGLPAIKVRVYFMSFLERVQLLTLIHILFPHSLSTWTITPWKSARKTCSRKIPSRSVFLNLA